MAGDGLLDDDERSAGADPKTSGSSAITPSPNAILTGRCARNEVSDFGPTPLVSLAQSDTRRSALR